MPLYFASSIPQIAFDGVKFGPAGRLPVNIADNFTEIEIDGVIQESLVSAYTFSTTGEHVVKYTLVDQTSIGAGSFIECANINSIELPNSVTSIGGWSFYQCSSLTSIDIPSGVTSIGDSAFYGCSGLTSITLPNDMTNIAKNTFYYCVGLTSCTIGSGTTSIGNDAFRNCSSLTSVTIPNSVTSIGNQAFYWCTSLISVTVNATTPPTLELDSHAFTNNEIGRKIYVPSTSVEVYKAAEGWSDYASDIEPIS